MKNMELNINGSVDFKAAEKAARKAASEFGGNFSLIAWYDKAKETGAPQEVCMKENWRCARDYADHHEASLRISVNGDAYEFFFTRIPADAEGLEKDEVAAIHEKASGDEFDNVQGG
jgi:hypothetical protein